MNNRSLVTVLVLVIVIIIIGWFMSSKGLFSGGRERTTANDKLSSYQAVFLTNGQVYFGKLSDKSAKYLRLSDIYYLQLAQAPQPEQQKNQQPQVSLVKLGQELHGPDDEMLINREQVLFIERMRKDAKVVEAIDRFKKEGPASLQGTPNPAETPSPKK